MILHDKMQICKIDIEGILGLNDISKITRKRDYVFARYWLYNLAYQSKTKKWGSQEAIGSFFGQGHAMVVHAVKEFPAMLREYDHFRMAFEHHSPLILKKIKRNISLNSVLKMNEIGPLKKQMSEELKKSQLENSEILAELQKLKEQFAFANSTIKMLGELSEFDREDFIEFKLKPFLQMRRKKDVKEKIKEISSTFGVTKMQSLR